jgi:hypothetical protein
MENSPHPDPLPRGEREFEVPRPRLGERAALRAEALVSSDEARAELIRGRSD